MTPATLTVCLVSIYPIVYAILLSLYKTKYLHRVEFAGFDNYIHLLKDPLAIKNLQNTLIYVFGSLVIVIPLGLGLAILLNQDIKFRSVFRIIIILPWVISQTIIALLWSWLLNPDFGPIIYLLSLIAGFKLSLLSNPQYALATLIGINAWGTYPMAVILFLAALQIIPREIIDAARVDGASRYQHLIHITIPLLKPTLTVVSILLTLLYFNMVTLVFILTGGGPLGATEVFSLRAFKEAFDFWHIGYASTFGVFLLVFNIIFSLVYIRLLRQERLY